ncbi:MAG: PaaI family thioesterase [Acidobacteria bacterium]|jgi:acyl-coenzyme A thioesterase PaaI-like protein|nr:PaaI family thioesterase [Acidobacteriota bacterium]
MSELTPPEGYAPHFRKSRFTDPWEPLFSRSGEREVSIGLRLGEAHCNSRGLVHGGLIAAIADNAMGLSCGAALASEGHAAPGGLVTVTLSTDYLGTARLGQWFATHTHFVKTGRSLCFADCLVQADGRPIARANATFKVLGKVPGSD